MHAGNIQKTLLRHPVSTSNYPSVVLLFTHLAVFVVTAAFGCPQRWSWSSWVWDFTYSPVNKVKNDGALSPIHADWGLPNDVTFLGMLCGSQYSFNCFNNGFTPWNPAVQRVCECAGQRQAGGEDVLKDTKVCNCSGFVFMEHGRQWNWFVISHHWLSLMISSQFTTFLSQDIDSGRWHWDMVNFAIHLFLGR